MIARGAWAALVIAGIALLFVGGFAYAACTTGAFTGLAGPSAASTVACFPVATLLIFGVVLLIAGIVLAVVSSGRTTRIIPSVNPAVPPPIINPVVIQQTIQEQVVKIRCRYCGALADATSAACPQCGAPL